LSVRARPRVLLTACLLSLPSGCVYYNGMYNAERAAAEAGRFERQGRTAEARDRWQRAIVHAESVAVRHPRSRWAADALLLQGRGLVQVERFNDAATVLEAATRRARPGLQQAQAHTLLGQAYLAVGRLDNATAALDTALALGQRQVEAEALLFRGRVRLAVGLPAAALDDFTASLDPRAAFDRARTRLVLRDTAGAASQMDSLAAARPYDERAWREALDGLGALGAVAGASRLAGLLGGRADLTRGEQARLLLDDADRLRAAGDAAAAQARYRDAAQAAPDSVEARLAAVRGIRLALVAAQLDADLEDAARRLGQIAADGGAPAREAQATIRVLGRIAQLTQDDAAPDARWFVRAELLRDSLHAGGLAVRAFAAMGERFPGSPWTPKALLAAIAAGHQAADSLWGVLDARYAASPYRRAAAGTASPAEAEAYRALEDSLLLLTAQGAAERDAERRPTTPDAERADEPGQGRRPAPGVPPTAPAPRPTPPPGDRPRDVPPPEASW
jgi:tetratricopeptide (TPR) repeat protein